MAVREQKEPQIYDHYFCNFETFDEPIDSYFDDDTIQRFIFIHGRCKGDLQKPHLSYAPLLRSILSSIRSRYSKKAIVYMPEYHEFIGLEPYEPWSLKSGPISREIRESVLWQIAKWKYNKFSFITNSWGCWHSMKLLNNEEIRDYVERVTFIAPVFNCWMIEEKGKYILNDNENNIEICGIYGSNDMQCNNDSKDGGIQYCLSTWFDTRYLRVICIEGGTHGAIYDVIPNTKWNRRKWIIGSSTQQFYNLWGGNTKEYKDKISKYEEPALPQNMNQQQYRDKIAENVAKFMFGDEEMKSMVVKLRKNENELKMRGLIKALCLIDALIHVFN